MTRDSLRRAVWFGLAVALGLAASSSRATAQLVVLRVDPAAEPLCRNIEMLLSDFGIVPDTGYDAEAQRRGLDPSGDAALTQLTPVLNAQLALVPQSADATSTLIEFRDGRTGASLGSATIPMPNGVLGWQSRAVFEAEIRKRLQPQTSMQAQAPPATLGEALPASAPSASAETAAPSEGGDLYLRVFGGLGIGMRDVSWPAAGETLSVETGAFPAVELGTGFGLWLGRGTALGPDLVYQTSLHDEIDEKHVGGTTETLGIRAHRFEALLALTLHLNERGSAYIAPEFGYALRNLRPAVHHLDTPSYTLGGPLLRLTVRIPFGSSVALLLAPEGQYVLVGDALRERGVNSTGLALGGRVTLAVELSEQYAIELVYREAHAFMSSALGGTATDVERFATARLVWQP